MTKYLALAFVFLFSCGLMFDVENQKKVALVYAQSDYTFINDLTGVAGDAISFGEYLKSQGYEVRMRLDKETDGSTYPILDEMDNLAESSKAQFQQDFTDLGNYLSAGDIFLFYYAGHGDNTDRYPITPAYTNDEGGDKNENTEYIILVDGSLNMSSHVYIDEIITDDELRVELEKIDKNVFKSIIMDSCNSGGFVGSGADTDNLSDNFDLNTQAVTSPWDTYWNSTISRDIPSDLAIMITASGEYEFSQDLDFAVYGDVFQPFALPTLSVEDTFPLPDPPTSVTYRGDRGTFTFFLEYGLKSGIADINQ
jgi:hypothetical protein